MRVGWLLLTMGDRPAQLDSARESIQALEGPSDLTVVHNGVEPPPTGASESDLFLPENLGVAAGRNSGWRHMDADIICFLDDDATVAPGFDMAALLDRFEQDENLGIVSFRIVDPESGATAQRHVPRLGKGSETKEFEATSFLGGACAVRRSVMEELDGYWDELFYSHEETELAWRAIDHSYRIVYAPELVVVHDISDPRSRHPSATYRSIRNRVLIAKRDLPAPLNLLYPLVWTAITILRTRSSAEFASLRRGLREGVKAEVERHPIKWSTVWRLTTLGRPPVI